MQTEKLVYMECLCLVFTSCIYDHSTSTYTDIASRACEKRKGTVRLTCAELRKNLFHCYYRCGIHSSRLELKLCMYNHAVIQTHISVLALFVQAASLGYDYVDDDSNPFPVESSGQREDHGTSCAGEIAMVKDNGVCGVGVAYQSSITGE